MITKSFGALGLENNLNVNMILDGQEKRLGRNSQIRLDKFLKFTSSLDKSSAVVLRTDITDYTAFLNSDREQATRALQDLSAEIRNIVLSNSGVFEKCVGDRTISLFTSNFEPEIEGEKSVAERATKAAVEVARFFGALSRKVQNSGYDTKLRLRIGLSGGGVDLLGIMPSVSFQNAKQEDVFGEVISLGLGKADKGMRNFHQKSGILCDLAKQETLQNEIKLLEKDKDFYDQEDCGDPPGNFSELVNKVEVVLESLRDNELDCRTVILSDLNQSEGWRVEIEELQEKENFEAVDVPGGLTIPLVSKRGTLSYNEKLMVILAK